MEVIEIKALKDRIWLGENIEMLEKSPKEYYKGIFKEIVDEIRENKKEFLICNVCEE